jgi:hypothetical protein
MAFLSVAGTVVPVAEGSVKRDVLEIGDRMRTFDGSLRETIRNRVSSYAGETPPLLWADASSVFDTMNASTQPQNVSGTMLSSGGATTVTMMTRALKSRPVQSGTQEAFIVSWIAEESS